MGAIFDEGRITAFFNNQPYHGSMVALNMANNAILKGYKGDDYEINVVNFPLPYQGEDKVSGDYCVRIEFIGTAVYSPAS